MSDDDLTPDEAGLDEEDGAALQLQAYLAAPVNAKNQMLQPMPLQVQHGVLETSEGPAGAMTFMHGAGEFTMIVQDPQMLDQFLKQVAELKDQMIKAATRYALLHPNGAQIVVPVPNVPGANGAKLL